MQYTIKSRRRINRIEITVKLTNHSVLCSSVPDLGGMLAYATAQN